jgi:hypothetical protein
MFKILLVIMTMMLSGCLPDSLTKFEEDAPVSAAGSSGATAPTGCQNRLCVKVETAYLSGGTSITQGTCTTDTTSDSCTITAPEGELFYSKTKFTVETNGDCAVIRFRPFYYKMSDNAAFTDITATALDCSNPINSLNPAGCFYGPATTLTGFPAVTGTFTDTGNTKTLDFEYDSPSNQDIAATACTMGNRWIANSASAGQKATGNDTTDCNGYVINVGSGDYVDYKAECVDKFSDAVADITIILNDSDGGTNDHETWVP